MTAVLGEGMATDLVFVDLVLRPTRKDLLFAPIGHGAEVVAADEGGKRCFVGPFAGDEVGGAVDGVFPERRAGVSISGVEGTDNAGEFVFKILLFAFDDVIVHADCDHNFRYLCGK